MRVKNSFHYNTKNSVVFPFNVRLVIKDTTYIYLSRISLMFLERWIKKKLTR